MNSHAADFSYRSQAVLDGHLHVHEDDIVGSRNTRHGRGRHGNDWTRSKGRATFAAKRPKKKSPCSLVRRGGLRLYAYDRSKARRELIT